MKKRAWSVLSFTFSTMVAAFLLMASGLKTTATVASAESGPGMRTLGSIPGQCTPVKFDHPKHVIIAGNYALRHHQHKDIMKLNCMGCHSITPSRFNKPVKSNFMACSARNSSPDANNPLVPGRKVAYHNAYHKQCFQCHRGFLPI